jgi:serine/threonine protein kinase
VHLKCGKVLKMIEAGTVLQNRYRIDKKIGQGGMGAVFVATDERFGSVVAIKETFFTDEGYRRAFEREARLLNNLRHTALPRVSDHFSEDNGQFLVMEYITGDDLSEKLETSSTPFPVTDVLNWADQLLDALDFLHTQESPVIHRDIKPQNLKLTPRGQIILLDFGLAKGNPTDAKHQTAAQSVFGYSRNYASLEQIQGTGTDPRSDLYSLAATLYHLMTGIPPVDALTRAMTVLNGDEDPLPIANTVHSQVPREVAEVLARAMALNANHRPTSAIAMRTMLNESEKLSADDFKTTPIKNSATGLLSQNTEVFENSPPASRNTEQSAIKTEVLPAAISQGIVNKPLTKSSDVNLFENSEQNSVETKFDANKQNAVRQNAETQILTPTEANQPKPRKRAMAVSATAVLGGLLAVGSALGGLYVLKPDVFGGTVSNSNVTVEQKSGGDEVIKSVELSSENADNSNTLANAPATVNSNPTISTKKITTEKTPAEIPAPKTPAPAKENQIETLVTTEAPAAKKEAKIVAQDQEGNKVYEDGTVKAKDGTIVTPDGKVVKNGVVIVNPGKNQPSRPTPPDAQQRPPMTREQIENLPPAQRRKAIQIMKRRNQQMPPNNPPPRP